MKKQSQSQISDYKYSHNSVKSKPGNRLEERDSYLSQKRKKELEIIVTSVLSIPTTEEERAIG